MAAVGWFGLLRADFGCFWLLWAAFFEPKSQDFIAKGGAGRLGARGHEGGTEHRKKGPQDADSRGDLGFPEYRTSIEQASNRHRTGIARATQIFGLGALVFSSLQKLC